MNTVPLDTGQPLLEIDNLQAGFVTDNDLKSVLQGVSFTIQQGELVALVGESGSGKSLSALSTLGLLNHIGARRTGGSIYIHGTDIASLTSDALRQMRGGSIGYIPQDPLAAFNPMQRIGTQMDTLLRAHTALDANKRRQLAIQQLQAASLTRPEGVYRSYPHQLSGGMLQRVMIAMALSLEPELLIADECTTGLDTITQRTVIDLLVTLVTERNLALLFITHDIALAANIADRILVMHNGAIVEGGNVEEIIAHPQQPYTKELISSCSA